MVRTYCDRCKEEDEVQVYQLPAGTKWVTPRSVELCDYCAKVIKMAIKEIKWDTINIEDEYYDG